MVNAFKLALDNKESVFLVEKSTVAIVKGERGHDPVFRALDLVDYKSCFAGYKQALIKVNFIAVKTWDTGATTDPIVVEAIIKKLAHLPIDVKVVESDATMTNANRAYEDTGMKEMCERNGVEFINLRYEKDIVKIPIPNGLTLRAINVPRIVTESAIISAAKLKTHLSTKVTLGMKNMFGLLPDKYKFKYHVNGISKVIVDINSVIHPALTVIDGFVGMEGKGPTDGTPVKANLIFAGKDVVATDATAARAIGFDPLEISHIRNASEKGLGNIDNIDIVGSSLEEIKLSFKTSKA